MIEQVLSPNARWAEAFDDPPEARLEPAELPAVAAAVAPRRREFATGRWCARRALADLGVAAVPLPRGDSGAPRWPAGVVGSITHCDGYRGCAVAWSRDLAAIGIDAEPNRPLPGRVFERVSRADERAWLAALPTGDGACWDRLLFSAKESIYKASSASLRRRPGYEDVVVAFDAPTGRFRGRLFGAGPTLEGRWLAADGLLLTAVATSAAN